MRTFSIPYVHIHGQNPFGDTVEKNTTVACNNSNTNNYNASYTGNSNGSNDATSPSLFGSLPYHMYSMAVPIQNQNSTTGTISLSEELTATSPTSKIVRRKKSGVEKSDRRSSSIANTSSVVPTYPQPSPNYGNIPPYQYPMNSGPYGHGQQMYVMSPEASFQQQFDPNYNMNVHSVSSTSSTSSVNNIENTRSQDSLLCNNFVGEIPQEQQHGRSSEAVQQAMGMRPPQENMFGHMYSPPPPHMYPPFPSYYPYPNSGEIMYHHPYMTNGPSPASTSSYLPPPSNDIVFSPVSSNNYVSPSSNDSFMSPESLPSPGQAYLMAHHQFATSADMMASPNPIGNVSMTKNFTTDSSQIPSQASSLISTDMSLNNHPPPVHRSPSLQQQMHSQPSIQQQMVHYHSTTPSYLQHGLYRRSHSMSYPHAGFHQQEFMYQQGPMRSNDFHNNISSNVAPFSSAGHRSESMTSLNSPDHNISFHSANSSTESFHLFLNRDDPAIVTEQGRRASVTLDEVFLSDGFAFPSEF